ncbi:protein of unknown function [Candidatus Filomicrobium marinum]|nr:protein of unknown function [Candidatus Filomicrobium marinum]
MRVHKEGALRFFETANKKKKRRLE